MLAGLWTFAALPALCTAGVLVHPCDCQSDKGCSHETECSDDPCNSVAPPREESTWTHVEALLAALIPILDVPREDAFVLTPFPPGVTASILDLAEIPYFDSDTPLLV